MHSLRILSVPASELMLAASGYSGLQPSAAPADQSPAGVGTSA